MIKIVTDANVNLPRELVDRFDITLVPAYIIFGDDQIPETEITTQGVIQRLTDGAEFPKTSQPAPNDFVAVYCRLLDDNPGTTILSLHITGAGSGTVESARRAASEVAERYPGASIYVLDTRAFAIGQALMVREAAIMAQLGEAVETILARLQDMRERVRTYFVLDTLDYVYRGGRIGRAAHLLGSLLNIKPVLTVRDGVMESYARFRTQNQAFDALYRLVLKAGENVRGLRVAIGYVVHDSAAYSMAERLKASLDLDELMVTEIGSALAAFTGPGALGISWYAPATPATEERVTG